MASATRDEADWLRTDNSTYSILEFNPYVTPNTLQVAGYYDTADGNLKAWLSRHPVNPSEQAKKYWMLCWRVKSVTNTFQP